MEIIQLGLPPAPPSVESFKSRVFSGWWRREVRESKHQEALRCRCGFEEGRSQVTRIYGPLEAE